MPRPKPAGIIQFGKRFPGLGRNIGIGICNRLDINQINIGILFEN